ncbi:hypothetical protein A3A45_03785 [Candidatus Daviesbacteria bacterium RIFCSPLOWO2_01_FULL_36_8]|nr:MAG: hypothetical protein A3A45_03785 [Candidatus Daviesbacteria bacterium RIFCSPLOWO2_01_FULL_36_8]
MKKIKLGRDYILLSLFFVLNFLIQSYNLGKLVFVFTDAGVYLYSAKLLAAGLIPYKDFFLAQPPYLLYFFSGVLSLVNFDIKSFNFLYIIWGFLSIIPIYFITKKFTGSILLSSFSVILFSTFSELVQWEAHSFALRQASLPLLSFSLFFIYIFKKPKISAFLLGIFSLTLISNFLISIALLISLRKFIRENLSFLRIFLGISLLGYTAIFLIPNGYTNLIGYHLNRPFLGYWTRMDWIFDYAFATSWPILVFGLLGSLIVKKEYRSFGLFNILSLIFVMFGGKSFYNHYLTILAVGFSISSSFLFSFFLKIKFGKFLIVIICILSVYFSSYNYLKATLITMRTPDFFETVDILKTTPKPLFTFEPIYGLYSKKELTYHYFVADMRYFQVLGTNLDQTQYLDVIKNSNTVLVEPFMLRFLQKEVLDKIKEDFNLIYSKNENYIYVRK